MNHHVVKDPKISELLTVIFVMTFKIGFLVSKETVVLRRCERIKTKILALSNELIKVELPP